MIVYDVWCVLKVFQGHMWNGAFDENVNLGLRDVCEATVAFDNFLFHNDSENKWFSVLRYWVYQEPKMICYMYICSGPMSVLYCSLWLMFAGDARNNGRLRGRWDGLQWSSLWQEGLSFQLAAFDYVDNVQLNQYAVSCLLQQFLRPPSLLKSSSFKSVLWCIWQSKLAAVQKEIEELNCKLERAAKMV